MSKQLRNLILRCLYIPFIFHIVSYKFSKNKLLINEDLDILMVKCGINGLGYDLLLIYFLLKNRYYRNIFYNRIGKLSILFSWLLPKDKYFFPCENIEGGIYPAHPFSTIINANKVGKKLVIRQCTTIGNKIDGLLEQRPTIGDNVNIGANVNIVGNIKIGNNVIIGAGTVITKDVPDNVIIVGNPYRIIKYIVDNENINI